MKLDAEKILEVLSLEHPAKEWAFFEELRIGTGFAKESEQRLDAWAICYHPSKRNVTRAFEIKVSKSDFKSEINKPLKRRAGMRFSNEFYFVTPKGLVDYKDIPYECGLIEVDDNLELTTVIPAIHRDIWPSSWLFLASIARRADKERQSDHQEYQKHKKRMKLYTNIAKQTIDRHVDMWKNYKDGNKEVPDKIAKAIEDLKLEIEDNIDITLRG